MDIKWVILFTVNVLHVTSSPSAKNILENAWKPKSSSSKNKHISSKISSQSVNSKHEIHKIHAELIKTQKELEQSQNEVLKHLNEIQKSFIGKKSGKTHAGALAAIASNNNVFATDTKPQRVEISRKNGFIGSHNNSKNKNKTNGAIEVREQRSLQTMLYPVNFFPQNYFHNNRVQHSAPVHVGFHGQRTQNTLGHINGPIVERKFVQSPSTQRQISLPSDPIRQHILRLENILSSRKNGAAPNLAVPQTTLQGRNPRPVGNTGSTGSQLPTGVSTGDGVFFTSMSQKPKKEYPIDQLILQAVSGSKSPEGPFDTPPMFYDVSSSIVIKELDIAVDRAESPEMFSFPVTSAGLFLKKKRRKKRALLRNTQSRTWPKATIPYTIDSNFNGRDQQMIRNALKEYERYTCLRFVPVTDTSHRNKLKFKDSMGCFSHVGYKGMRKQDVGLKEECRTHKIILHEVGHAVGMYHEQARTDRDSWITIVNRNIKPSALFNFDKIDEANQYNWSIPYDYLSIMHYGEKFFSIDGEKITMQTKNPIYQQKIGNSQNLSFRDIKAVNTMYKCAGRANCPQKSCSHFSPEAFVGKDCQCWCPALGGKAAQPCRGFSRRQRPVVVTQKSPRRETAKSQEVTRELMDLLQQRRRRIEANISSAHTDIYLNPAAAVARRDFDTQRLVNILARRRQSPRRPR